jgi:hypothetical protein
MVEYEISLGPLLPLVVPMVQNALQAGLVPNSSLLRARNQDRSGRRGGFAVACKGAGYGTIPSAESAKVHSAYTFGTSALASAGHLFGLVALIRRFAPPSAHWGEVSLERPQSRSGIPSTELTCAIVPGTNLPRSPRGASASGRGGVSISCPGSPRFLFHGLRKRRLAGVAATTLRKVRSRLSRPEFHRHVELAKLLLPMKSPIATAEILRFGSK